MLLSPPLRKLALAVHVTAGVGWIGAVFAFLALAVVSMRSADEGLVRSSFIAMNVIVRAVIVPIAFASLVSGLVSSLGTTWGLFRQYWVLIKLALTLIAIAILLVQLRPISDLAVAAADATRALSSLVDPQRPLVHAIGGLVVLLIVQVLGIFKPKGLTRYGWRKANDVRSPAPPPLSPPGA